MNAKHEACYVLSVRPLCKNDSENGSMITGRNKPLKWEFRWNNPSFAILPYKHI
jgi:hypothetical protein